MTANTTAKITEIENTAKALGFESWEEAEAFAKSHTIGRGMNPIANHIAKLVEKRAALMAERVGN